MAHIFSPPPPPEGKVYLFTNNSSEPIWSHNIGQYITSVAISTDGTHIIVGSEDGKVYLFL